MVDEERWQARFRAARVSLPGWAKDAPHRCTYRSNVTGTWEIYAWDRTSDVRRQVTDRANGTWMGGVEATGQWIWWFADTDGDEFGIWMRQPFDGGADRPAVDGLEPSFPAGIAVGSSGLALVGRTGEQGTSIHLCPPATAPTTLYEHREDAHLVGLSRDETLVAINHSEHGDSRHMALRVVRLDGGAVADLWDGEGKGVYGIEFSPVSGDPRLLVLHERRGRPEPLIWDPVAGTERDVPRGGEPGRRVDLVVRRHRR